MASATKALVASESIRENASAIPLAQPVADDRHRDGQGCDPWCERKHPRRGLVVVASGRGGVVGRGVVDGHGLGWMVAERLTVKFALVVPVLPSVTVTLSTVISGALSEGPNGVVEQDPRRARS